jgi:ATP-dependent exoDNAse (exonuclease V) alpha subunit
MKYTSKQDIFLDAVMQGQNIFLTGKAGSGKSFIVKEAIKKLRKSGKKVVALAPTGIAANNIGGQTIHSFFSIPPFGMVTYETANFIKNEKRRILDLVDVIFIDEISMARADLLDGINITLLKNGCKKINKFQFVFIGDMKQLKPVVEDNMKSVLLQNYKGIEWYNARCMSKINPKEIELTEIVRQSDPEFIAALNIIREGGKSEYFRQFLHNEPNGIILAPHNSTVTKWNNIGLQSLSTELYTFKATIEGTAKLQDFNLEPIIQVKNGAKIMYLINSSDNNNLFNGTLGIFIEDDEGFFIDVKGVQYPLEPIKLSKKQYILNKDESDFELKEIGSITQYPFKLAYALTIHKSQGLTFESVTLDLTKSVFESGQLYVALSRVTGPDGLRIITN